MFQKNETYTILEECHLMSNIPKRNLASGYRNGSLSADVAGIVHVRKDVGITTLLIDKKCNP